MGNELLKSVCISRSCGWNSFSGTIGCSSGDNSCLTAEFLTANQSDFYTAELLEATVQIQNILGKIKRPRGRKLALLNTPFGVLLAWANHDVDVPAKSVDIHSSPTKIIKALGLKGVKRKSRTTK
jgi:hypothetical protein